MQQSFESAFGHILQQQTARYIVTAVKLNTIKREEIKFVIGATEATKYDRAQRMAAYRGAYVETIQPL